MWACAHPWGRTRSHNMWVRVLALSVSILRSVGGVDEMSPACCGSRETRPGCGTPGPRLRPPDPAPRGAPRRDVAGGRQGACLPPPGPGWDPGGGAGVRLSPPDTPILHPGGASGNMSLQGYMKPPGVILRGVWCGPNVPMVYPPTLRGITWS